MNAIEETVRKEAVNLQPGETRRVICPVCCAVHEKSFTIRRDAYEPQKIWFRCWRAACDPRKSRGRMTDADGIRMVTGALDRLPDATLPLLTTLPPNMLVTLAEQLEVAPSFLARQELQYDPIEKATYYPWYNWKLERLTHVGWQSRTQEKLMRLRPDPHQQSDMYTVPRGRSDAGPVVFVENVWSAYKIAALGGRAIALFGHNLSLTTASAVRNGEGSREAVVLLDPDCWPDKVSNALRHLSARGWKAHALHISEKPHRMKNVELVELLDLM